VQLGVESHAHLLPVKENIEKMGVGTEKNQLLEFLDLL
jgi:hypothetical protein